MPKRHRSRHAFSLYLIALGIALALAGTAIHRADRLNATRDAELKQLSLILPPIYDSRFREVLGEMLVDGGVLLGVVGVAVWMIRGVGVAGGGYQKRDRR